MSETATTTAMDPLPVWVDDSHIDPAWIRHHAKLACTECLVKDISNQGRLGESPRDGATLKLTVTLEDSPEPLSLVVKQVPPKGRPTSQMLGLAREAFFYNQLAPDVKSSDPQQSIIPKILYAHGDMKSGAKVVVMEDLSQSAVDSGVFFGPGNPNNWKRDLPAMAARAGPNVPTAAKVAKRTFVELAQVHAAFWCRTDLLDAQKYDWMRGHAWLKGEGKESWEASQGMLSKFWNAYLEREKDEANKDKLLDWDPVVRAAVEKSIQAISWEDQLKRLHKDGRWTAVHGDCWPGNFMWMINLEEDKTYLKLLDWEMAGLGSGPQDLGQYVLSNMDPFERQECEEDLIKAYFEELQKCGVTNVDWDYCWSEYKFGGLERWLWFLIYFAGQPPDALPGWAQFFHNQISAFMKDHNISADDVGQPRP